ncbi:MAG TPA: bifunctional hydroxymethylpyrimidine kinase/phosphomethylpyrimidine kinase [Smithellaceae bacterium]|nr:bifunctional hydroxymethylpyrimidine kinase/phosphomethylpyrimidine kinase [Smithellaceae bacterium]
MNGPFKVLCIGGSDSGGGAGIQADLKAVHACGGYGTSVITALTAQNTRGVQDIFPVPPKFVAAQLDAVLSDIGADAVKTGMLMTAGAVNAVVSKIEQYRLKNVVVDPVMIAKGGRTMMQEAARQTIIKKLLPLTWIVTPNIPEAESLAQVKIRSITAMKKAAAVILDLGVKNVVIKGGHLPGRKLSGSTDILYDGKKYYTFSADWIETKNTHGTGCTYASALAAGLAQGKSIFQAVEQAKAMVTRSIEQSLCLGHGHGPVNFTADEVAQNECLHGLQAAMNILTEASCGQLIPEVQSNLVYAEAGASQESQVAGFPGRIIRFRDGVRVLANPEFGASQHIAHIVLTVLKHDSSHRSAMNIKYSEKIIDVCRRIGFAVERFDRADEPAENKNREGFSLEWGVNSVLARTRMIPDIIYDRGGWGKEPMVRVLGRNPVEVVHKVLRILKHL